MNKSFKRVLISIQPYWYYLIGEGIKKIEVRKTIPQAPDWNRQVECYMTKDKKSFARIPKAFQEKYHAHMGKVGMRFVCCECIPLPVNNKRDWTLYCKEQTCLSYNEIQSYTNGKQASGLLISDLIIHDTPKELSEFFTKGECQREHCAGCRNFHWGEGWLDGSYYDEDSCIKWGIKPLTRPPQSWCYAEAEK